MGTIGIMTYPVRGLDSWDPESIHRGITGSEEAVIYISQKLADRGNRVFIFGDSPEGSIHSRPSSNPRYLPRSQIRQSDLDVAISWRMPQIGGQLRRFAKKVYLWPADTLSERILPKDIFAFDDVLWISAWQRSQWISVSPEWSRFTSIFGNGINPEEFQAAEERENPYSCIYGSNYARGLEVLLAIWPAVKQHYPRATLDIYYGWQHWGCLTPEKEEKMRQILLRLPDVREHGLVGHAELNRAYSRASFWTYPCIAPETFCTTAIRAQMGGAIPVIIEGSALKETVRHGFRCDRVEDYLATLLKALRQAETIPLKDRQKMKDFVLRQFTWETIAAGWNQLFNH
jgi:glycosyltransferase involved in cell wall biosynthesis